MVKINTSELIGDALDLAVAKAWQSVSPAAHLLTTHAKGGFHPSTDWAQGGPIIEREKISVGTDENDWSADITAGSTGFVRGFGPTSLIAAMRCYVASKLGDEIVVPDDLS